MPFELNSKTARLGKGEAAGFHSWADGFAVCRAATCVPPAKARRIAANIAKLPGGIAEVVMVLKCGADVPVAPVASALVLLHLKAKAPGPHGVAKNQKSECAGGEARGV